MKIRLKYKDTFMGEPSFGYCRFQALPLDLIARVNSVELALKSRFGFQSFFLCKGKNTVTLDSKLEL